MGQNISSHGAFIRFATVQKEREQAKGSSEIPVCLLSYIAVISKRIRIAHEWSNDANFDILSII